MPHVNVELRKYKYDILTSDFVAKVMKSFQLHIHIMWGMEESVYKTIQERIKALKEYLTHLEPLMIQVSVINQGMIMSVLWKIKFHSLMHNIQIEFMKMKEVFSQGQT